MGLRDAAAKALDGFDRKKGNVNEFEGLPSGDYVVMIDNIREQETPWGSEQLSIRAQVLDGEHAGQKEFINLSLDETTSKGNPNPMLGRNIKLIAKLASNSGIELQDEDWEDLGTLSEALAPAEGRTVLMHLTVSENKKNPQYPYRNYDFEEAEEIDEIDVGDDDLPF
ncbi:hypothetical protein CYR79_09720 [Ligilactobacillus agilis]|uniref:DUF669 domain-containing protein n=1 Tax=Ligilactobacillus agilis TaxID=1601 RepID=A0A2I2A8P7_9LACO|nr:DUF669 domain-containing protein [Ligilactobacillus agilis]PLA75754.1 hypothetical protein CYR79_09720 [Ligilactobacillus agilis]